MLTDVVKKKSKREEAIDKKIEHLLITYKKKDEVTAQKANNINAEKALGKRNLLDKFGFSDDEDDPVAKWEILFLIFNYFDL